MTTPTIRAIPLPFKVLDRYTTGPAGSWVKIEHPDGSQETLTPDAALDLVHAARSAEALGLLLLDPDAPAESVNAALSAWRRTAGYEEEVSR